MQQMFLDNKKTHLTSQGQSIIETQGQSGYISFPEKPFPTPAKAFEE